VILDHPLLLLAGTKDAELAALILAALKSKTIRVHILTVFLTKHISKVKTLGREEEGFVM